MTGSPAALFAALLAVTVLAGAVTALSTRDARLAVLGLLVALLAGPFVADPLPDMRGIAARLAGAVLVAYPLLIAIRGSSEPTTTGSRGGWPADALLALTAAVAAGAAAAGWDVAGRLGAGDGPGAGIGLAAGSELTVLFLPAIAAGTGVLTLAASAIAFGRDPLRLTVGLCLAILGLTIVQAGLGGPPSAFTDLCVAVLLATTAGGGAMLTRASRLDERST